MRALVVSCYLKERGSIMEQSKQSYLRSAIAVALVTVMLLAVPFAVVTQSDGVTDAYDGTKMIAIRPMMVGDQNMTLSVDANGDIQAKFDVYIENTEYTHGAYIYLLYNTEWLQASDFDDNSVITSSSSMDREEQDFFVINEDLTYQNATGERVSAIKEDLSSVDFDGIKQDYFRMLDADNGVITLQTIIDQDRLKQDYDSIDAAEPLKSLIHPIWMGEGDDYEYYFDNREADSTATENIAVKLGTLSFKVTSREALRQMVAYGKEVGGSEHWYKGASAVPNAKAPFTVNTETSGGALWGSSTYDYGWHINYYDVQKGLNGGIAEVGPKSHMIPAEAAAGFYYDFGDALVTAEPLTKHVTINAYQAYTYDGSDAAAARDNMAIVLGKYSPTIVASYADSATRNFVMNWGVSDNADYTYDYIIYEKVGDEWVDVRTIPNYVYNPQAGEYKATQYLYYKNNDGVIVKYPTPMEVLITVTPVTVVNVGADGLEKVYTQAEANNINEYDMLDLPDEVRIYTDVISGAPSLYLTIGGSEELPSWMPDMLENVKTPSNDGSAAINWPNADNASGSVYEFDLGDLASADPTLGDSYINRRTSAVYDDEILIKYPWLTVPEEQYPIKAKRTVYPDGTHVAVPELNYDVTYESTTASEYGTISAGSTIDYSADGLLLQLNVSKTTVDTTFGPSAAFKLRLPNGWVIEPDVVDGSDAFTIVDADGISTPVPASTGGSTEAQYLAVGTGGDISLSPGSDDYDADTAEMRDTIRRHINLGGYFAVSVCEDSSVADPIWSGFIEVYVPPRANYYEEDKTYNFIGLNAGLFDYAGVLSDTVTVPSGEYTPIVLGYDTNGTTPLATTNTHAAEAEDYGVLTTYDGLTGAQPGRTYTFRVEHASDTEVWGTAVTKPDAANPSIPDSNYTADKLVYDSYSYFNGATITRFNKADDSENRFADMVYDGYGKVINYRQVTGNDYEFEPTIRLDTTAEVVPPAESLRLIYEGPATNNVLEREDGQVAEVVFDTQTEGYTVRQSFVLTLVNDGTIDIHGLYIDTLKDIDLPSYNADGDPYGGHFEIVTPPSSYLAAGAKTTFTVTYVYDLRSNGTMLEYLDKLYVCSNAYGTDKPLKDFDARFAVTASDVNRVTVVVLPPFTDSDGSTFYLGEAGVITGLINEGDPDEYMDYTYASTMRRDGDRVYIGTFPYEEYEVEIVLADGLRDDSGGDGGDTGTTTGLRTPDKVNEYEGVYAFQMPANNVTVYVVFREPTRSKLRPADIIVYADENDPATAIDITDADNVKTLWQKEFLEDEETDAQAAVDAADSDMSNPLGEIEKDNIYNNALMTGGAAGGQGFDASIAHYLVVLEQEENVVQAEALLRKVKALYENSMAATGNVTYDALMGALGTDANLGLPYANGYRNADISPVNVVMKVYDEGESPLDPTHGDIVYTNVDVETPVGSDDSATKASATVGDTSVPTEHRSIVFDSPAEGSRKWLVITLSFDATEEPEQTKDANGDTDAERSYYIELVRRPSHSVTMAYGNSPVGMIYNTKAFVEKNASDEVILTDMERTLNTAGRTALETFVATRSFETAVTKPYAFEQGKLGSYTYNREAWVPYGQLYDPDSLTYTASYSENNDLDLDPHALFVVLGEDFRDPGLVEIKDSSMREVDPRRVERYIREVYVLDDSAGTEYDRFNTTATADIDIGTLYSGLDIASGKWQAKHEYVHGHIDRSGTLYPLFVEYDAVNDTEYFLDGTTYFRIDGNNSIALDAIEDADIIEKLEPKLVDKLGGGNGEPISIRPGIYELVYKFRDFDGGLVLDVARKLIVLAPVGDADASGDAYTDAMAETTVEKSDESLIEQRVGAPLGYEVGYHGANTFKFRSADANNDRNVNNIDANELHTKVTGEKQLPHFYDPVNYAEAVIYADEEVTYAP